MAFWFAKFWIQPLVIVLVSSGRIILMEHINRTILLILFFFSLMGKPLSAQMERSRVDSLSQEATLVKEERWSRVSTKFGPHYKNPNAGGRLTIYNRAAAAAIVPSQQARLTGPAFKNSKVRLRRSRSVLRRKQVRRSLSGPRYKNRRAKVRRR